MYQIFRVSELHLGHIAKSFGLRETPTESVCNRVARTHAFVARVCNRYVGGLFALVYMSACACAVLALVLVYSVQILIIFSTAQHIQKF